MLNQFVATKMKMTAIYQPVIIKCLLENNGEASFDLIADELVKLEGKQRSFYLERLAVHPKAVLKQHGVAIVEKRVYRLAANYSDKESLINLLNNKISQFMSK